MHGNMVLPPIGPLFAATANTTSSHAHGSAHQSPLATTITSRHAGASETPQHAALALLLCERSLRTPTSAHAHVYTNGVFPSSSPVKKDTVNTTTTTSPLTKPTSASVTKMGHPGTTGMLMLSLESPTKTSSLSHNDDNDGSASPTCEDEKLRLSRERNRLHAQRTRIRKRELLESLKERIHALESEHGLLKQAFEFHATAVCLLSLGTGGSACDDPAIKRLEAVSDAALEMFNTTTATTTLHACLDDDDDDLLLLDDCADGATSSAGHDKSCEWFDTDGHESEHADSGSGNCTCTCRTPLDQSPLSDQLNSNGKRLHASATAPLGGSKEEREQLRRERNRLHARRARLRKKLVLERSQQAVQELRTRNEYLRERLAVLITSIYGAGAATIATKPELCPMP